MSGSAHISKHFFFHIISTDINILNLLRLYFLLIRYTQTIKHLHNICLYRNTYIVYDIDYSKYDRFEYVTRVSELREHMFYLCTSIIGLILILSFNKTIRS